MPIDKARDSDIDAVIALHTDAFPGFFLTTIGPAFLRELYSAFLFCSDSIFLVSREGKSINGFVAGNLDPEHFFKRLLQKRWYAFVKAAFFPLLRRPMIVGRKLAGAVFYRGERPRCGDAALLSSLAVSPSASGRGIGSALVEAFCDAVAQRGKEMVYLITDRDTNDAANKFYARSGFYVDGVLQRQGGRDMNRYIRHLKRATPKWKQNS